MGQQQLAGELMYSQKCLQHSLPLLKCKVGQLWSHQVGLTGKFQQEDALASISYLLSLVIFIQRDII